jgi:hypothetical protein
MKVKGEFTLVCPNGHNTSFREGSREAMELAENKFRYLKMSCPKCHVQFRAVICSKCKNCVGPFQPCCKCGHYLIGDATCSSPVC